MFEIHPAKEDILRELEELEKRDDALRTRLISTRPLEMVVKADSTANNFISAPNEPDFPPPVLEKETTLFDILYGIEEKIMETFKFREIDGPNLREEILSELPEIREKLESEFYEREKEKYSHFLALEKQIFERRYFSSKNSLAKFAALCLFVMLAAPSFAVIGNALNLKENVQNAGMDAYLHLSEAKSDVKNFDFASAEVNFNKAYYGFLKVNNEIGVFGGVIVDILKNIPGFEKLSAGENLLEAGKYLARAGENISIAFEKFLKFDFKSVFDGNGLASEETITDKIFSAGKDIEEARENLLAAGVFLDKVDADGLPEIFGEIAKLRENLPASIEIAAAALKISDVALKAFGHYQPQKYLLIFQNPSEARATGGFIGSYGLLDVSKGKISNLFIDGIFNPDGQLREKIVPPRPLQRITTAWSTHDANWFFDFPASAEKISRFYEKTGGATPDGVIALTPKAVERLLDVFGPLPMPEYGITLTSKNLIERLQYEAEINYDKELNKPKQILSDLAPKIIDRIANASLEEWQKIISGLAQGLEEKDIMIYSLDADLQNFFVNQGWGGDILETDKDYLAVVHSNINGFKTDKVMEEEINLDSEIQNDGTIINTLTITRKHSGGGEQYDYWNRVNADYLRVYVPSGSKLLAASGHTVDVYVPPADYEALGFKTDADIAKIESSLIIDQSSGTHVFEETGKTVFGNWVYVSPGESVSVVYKYLLPFKIDFSAKIKNHGVAVQKQASLNASRFKAAVRFPSAQKIVWSYPDSLAASAEIWKYEDILSTDKFFGAVFEGGGN